MTFSTVAYLLVAIAGLVFVLISDIDFRLPNASWRFSAHLVFFFAFMFPAVSVMSLIAGWGLYASRNNLGAIMASLCPWAWGVAVVFLSVARLISCPTPPQTKVLGQCVTPLSVS